MNSEALVAEEVEHQEAAQETGQLCRGRGEGLLAGTEPLHLP